MAAAAILNLFESKVAPLDPPSPKTPPYNQTWSGSDHPLQRYGHSRMLGAYGTPILGGRGGRRGSAMAPLERAMVVSYRLSYSCAICNHSAAICDRMSPTLKSTGRQTTCDRNTALCTKVHRAVKTDHTYNLRPCTHHSHSFSLTVTTDSRNYINRIALQTSKTFTSSLYAWLHFVNLFLLKMLMMIVITWISARQIGQQWPTFSCLSMSAASLHGHYYSLLCFKGQSAVQSSEH